jgi:predicted DNA-binding transcriptional regulator AlpA
VEPEKLEDVKWYSVLEVAQMLGIGRRTLFTWIAEGKVPPPVKWSERDVRWRENVIGPIVREGPKPKGTFTEQLAQTPAPRAPQEVGRGDEEPKKEAPRKKSRKEK